MKCGLDLPGTANIRSAGCPDDFSPTFVYLRDELECHDLGLTFFPCDGCINTGDNDGLNGQG